jgi:nucleotide-binding universal stress UspA family protein
MKKILVPTNFSKPAEWAIEIAADIARMAGAEIVLLNVVDYKSETSLDIESNSEELKDWIKKGFARKVIEQNKTLLDECVTKLGDGDGVKKVMRMGSLVHAINSVMNDQKIDLVVMGTTVRTRIEEVTAESKTAKVVKFSTVPVLTIHQKATGVQFKDIVYATALSDDETTLSETIKNTQKLYKASLHIVRVNTPANSRPEDEVKKEMEAFAKNSKLENYTLNTFDDSSEDMGIIRFADSINADLIAIATSGRTSLAHNVKGNVSQDIVNRSAKPVLTCRIG